GGITLHRRHEIGDQVGTALILVLHVSPARLGCFFEGRNGVVAAGRKRERKADNGKNNAKSRHHPEHAALLLCLRRENRTCGSERLVSGLAVQPSTGSVPAISMPKPDRPTEVIGRDEVKSRLEVTPLTMGISAP